MEKLVNMNSNSSHLGPSGDVNRNVPEDKVKTWTVAS